MLASPTYESPQTKFGRVSRQIPEQCHSQTVSRLDIAGNAAWSSSGNPFWLWLAPRSGDSLDIQKNSFWRDPKIRPRKYCKTFHSGYTLDGIAPDCLQIASRTGILRSARRVVYGLGGSLSYFVSHSFQFSEWKANGLLAARANPVVEVTKLVRAVEYLSVRSKTNNRCFSLTFNLPPEAKHDT